MNPYFFYIIEANIINLYETNSNITIKSYMNSFFNLELKQLDNGTSGNMIDNNVNETESFKDISNDKTIEDKRNENKTTESNESTTENKSISDIKDERVEKTTKNKINNKMTELNDIEGKNNEIPRVNISFVRFLMMKRVVVLKLYIDPYFLYFRD